MIILPIGLRPIIMQGHSEQHAYWLLHVALRSASARFSAAANNLC